MTPSELARFESKYVGEPNSGCWLWDGAVEVGGYGVMKVGKKADDSYRQERAHRLAYEHFVGPIPAGMLVCHRCDVRCCVNPAHLFVGTHQANMDDMYRKGRGKKASGDSHYSRRRPELMKRGDDHWSRRRPERVSRGERQGAAKLSDAIVSDVLRAVAAGESRSSVARRLGVSRATIDNVANRKRWTHVPMPSGAGAANDNDERENSAMT